MAAPFGAVYLYYDLTKPGRTLQAELTGPLALAFVASSIAVMDGWLLLNALALWAALSLRAVPSVLYVRARIRLDRGRAPNTVWPIVAHALALLTVGALIWIELLPALAVVPYIVLLVARRLVPQPAATDGPDQNHWLHGAGVGTLLDR